MNVSLLLGTILIVLTVGSFAATVLWGSRQRTAQGEEPTRERETV